MHLGHQHSHRLGEITVHFECERPEREIHNVQVGPPEIEGCRTVTLTTSRGDIECRDYAAPDS